AIPAAQCYDQFGAPLTVDQRGFPRPGGGTCDMGAYEGSLSSTLFGVNLIRNGDAEGSAASPVGAFVRTPYWDIPLAVVQYGTAGGFPTATDPGPTARGLNFFAGGVSDNLILFQDIDLQSAGTMIDSGQVQYDLSGYFGGFSTDDDHSEIRAYFRNVSGN